MSFTIVINPKNTTWDLKLNGELPSDLSMLPEAFNEIAKELLVNEFVKIDYNHLTIYKPEKLKNGFIVQPEINFLFNSLPQEQLIEIFTKMVESLNVKPDNLIHFGMMAAAAISSYSVNVPNPFLLIDLQSNEKLAGGLSKVNTVLREMTLNVGAILTSPTEFQMTM